MDILVYFSLEVFYYIGKVTLYMKELLNRIKYRFSIENISVNDCVGVFIVCAYLLFFIVDAAFPFNNLPMSFLILTIILFGLFLFAHFKSEYFEKPLNDAKMRKYEEKKKSAQAAYMRYLKQQQEKMRREREKAKSQSSSYKGSSNNTKTNKTEGEKKSSDNNKKEYNYYSDYGKYYEYKSKDKSEKKKTENDSYKQKEDNVVKGVEPIFFKNCTNIEQVEKTYKKLCQIYHPDQFTGDNEMFLTIKSEYEEMRRKFS